jgi:hypothetical protein
METVAASEAAMVWNTSSQEADRNGRPEAHLSSLTVSPWIAELPRGHGGGDDIPARSSSLLGRVGVQA